ncbi:MAG: hypothetical protein IKA80_06440 [Spirochaetaceae bacterium]|nr:hypothetical protein [Spirochaetaceae bacterium]
MAPGRGGCFSPDFLRKLVGLLVFVCNGIIILTGNIVRQECMDRLPLLQDKHCVAMIAGVGSCGHVYGGATAPAETEGRSTRP